MHNSKGYCYTRDDGDEETEMTKEKAVKRIKVRVGPEEIAYWIFRALLIFASVMMLFPVFNPGRISLKISQYASLFTTGVDYAGITGNLGRAFNQGWVERGSFILLSASSILIIIGTISCAIGGCMSLGNLKMRKVGLWFPIGGSFLMLIGLGGIFLAYRQVASSEYASRVEPNFSFGFYIYITVSLLILVISSALRLALRGKEVEEKMRMNEKYSLFLMFLPMIAMAFVFAYLPLWGWRYAFFDYTVGGTLSRETFVGFKWFRFLFQNPATINDITRVMRNTLVMSGLGLLTSWLPMGFAIFLNEIKSNRFKRVVQTLTTIPNFISWVLIYAIALAIFSTDGFLNGLINMLPFGPESQVNWLMSADYTWIKMLLWGTWKGVGWSAIIYIAAIAGIDPQLYEAATIDGAGRFGRIWHIIIPSLLPTYFVLLLMSIAGVLSNGMEQYLVFSNALNRGSIEVLDLYVYNIGITDGRIPLSTVVGMAKSLVSVALLFIANRTSKAIRGESII